MYKQTNNLFDNNNMRCTLESMNGFKEETFREFIPEFSKLNRANMWIPHLWMQCFVNHNKKLLR